jgi:hypothetical protein
MNAEALINVSQAVTHGITRQVRSLKNHRQGIVVGCEGSELKVRVGQERERWSCEDCE